MDEFLSKLLRILFIVTGILFIFWFIVDDNCVDTIYTEWIIPAIKRIG